MLGSTELWEKVLQNKLSELGAFQVQNQNAFELALKLQNLIL